MIMHIVKHALILTLLTLANTVAANEFQVVSVNDWGSGHIVQWEKAIDADDASSGAIDKWRIEPSYDGSGNISNAWMNGYNGSISSGVEDTGTYSITNESAGYRPELTIGQTLSFSIQIQGSGFNESDYSPELHNLSETVVEPEIDSSAQVVSVNDWYNPSWGGGFNVTYQCIISDGPINEWRIDANYSGGGNVVSAWTQSYNGSVDHGFIAPDGGYALTNANAGYIPTLNNGDTLTFVFQVDGAGYETSELMPVCTDLNAVPAAENSAPIANAGLDQSVQAGENVSLDGTASSDIDGDSLSFSWMLTQQPSTGSAQLSDSNSTMPNFVANTVGEYRISLTVNDGELDSALDEVTVTTENTIPVADAGVDQSVSVGDWVFVNGDNSYDANNDALAYSWTLLNIPENSQLDLAGFSDSNVSFLVDEPGQYDIQLIVSDGLSNSAPDSMLVNVENVNTAPVANAGFDEVRYVGDIIVLDGTLSNDVDNDTITYAWSFTVVPDGSQASLASSTSVGPSFEIDVPGQYIAQLIVSDGTDTSDADTVVIRTNSIPVAIANVGASNFPIGEEFTLDGSESFDLDDDVLSYEWTLTELPNDSLAVLGNSTLSAVTFTTDAPGSYVFQLVVNDGLIDSQSTFVEVVSTIPLLLTVDSPTEGSYLNGSPVVVTGTIFPVSANIVINGQEVIVDASGYFSTSLVLSEGDESISVVASDSYGNEEEQIISIVVDRTDPLSIVYSAVSTTSPDEQGNITVTGQAGSVEPNAWVEIVNPSTGETVRVQADATGAFSATISADIGDVLEVVVEDLATNRSSATTLNVQAPLPPDPATIAPSLPTTQLTPIGEQWEFLYNSENPVQFDMDPDTINPEQVALLRGRVLDVNGNPLAGVRMSVKDYPEFGYTLTRLDGMWDLVINGGGNYVIDYELDGYLPLQRRLVPTWRDVEVADDVVMTAYDNQVTAINTADASSPFQIATGADVDDGYRPRKLHMLFPSGTQAHFRNDAGEQIDLSVFNVRATEYTVGELGPSAMPGELPPASMYTYAMELSLDEAIDAVPTDGKTVWFDNPVIVYIDNFMDIPDGIIVPLGYYNREIAAWETEQDGRIMKILSLDSQGRAVLTGFYEGLEATDEEITALGITDEERAEIAQLYQVGDSFQRLRVSHFSPFDANYWSRNNRPAPPSSAPNAETPENFECVAPAVCGSVIDVLEQTLREFIPVTGTGMNLVYSSDQSEARLNAKRKIEVQVTTDTPPEYVFNAKVKIQIAGNIIEEEWVGLDQSSTNLTYEYEWDGIDAYGRELVGEVPAEISLMYIYYPTIGLSNGASGGSGSFGSAGGNISRDVNPGCSGCGEPPSLIMASNWTQHIPAKHSLINSNAALGGWTLDQHHSYEPRSRKLVRGDGTRLTTGLDTASRTIEQVYTRDELISSGQNEDMANAMFISLYGARYLQVAKDGTVYMAGHYEIYRIKPDGIAEKLAGEYWPANESTGNGGLLANANFETINAMELGPDGNLYILDDDTSIRKAQPDGIIEEIPLPSDFDIRSSTGLAIDRRGNIMLCMTSTYNRDYQVGIYRLTPSGDLSPLVVESDDNPSIDLGELNKQCVYDENNDSLVFYTGTILKRLDLVTGEIIEFAGNGEVRPRDAYEGMPSEELDLSVGGLRAFDVDRFGNLYFCDKFCEVIYSISDDGEVSRVAGGYSTIGTPVSGDKAIGYNLADTFAFDIGPDNALWFTETYRSVSKLDRAMPGSILDSLASFYDRRLNEIHSFTSGGLIAQSKDPDSDVAIALYNYDDAGQLASILDRDGDSVEIHRDSDSSIRIEGYDGQMTYLSLDANGQLDAVSNEADQLWSLDYNANGELTQFTKPSQASTTFAYDQESRLISEIDPVGGGWTFNRTELADGHSVQAVSGEGRIRTLSLEFDDVGGRAYTTVLPDGTTTTKSISSDGTTTTSYPTGEIRTTTYSSGERFGELAKLESSTITLPSGLEMVSSEEMEIGTSVDDQPVYQYSQTVNGRTSSNTYTVATKTLKTSSPAYHRSANIFDDKHRLISSTPEGMATSSIDWREDGKILSLTTSAENQSDRTTFYNYFSGGSNNGFLESITDASDNTYSYNRDAIGRAIGMNYPDSGSVFYSYDDNGNLAGIMPPARDSYLQQYDSRDLIVSKIAPNLSSTSAETSYNYNLDRQIDLIVRRGGAEIDFQYDETTGQLRAIDSPRGLFQLTYKPETGQIASRVTPEGNAINYSYNGSLLVESEWQGAIGGSVSVQYNNDFVPQSSSVNDENIIAYEYDNDLFLTQAGDLAITRSHSQNFVTGTRLDSVSISIAYNDFGEVRYFNANADSSSIYRANYGHDDLGRIISIIEVIEGDTSEYLYEYDSNGRLLNVRKNGVLIENYIYDLNGNRIGESTSRGMISVNEIIVDSNDRLLQNGPSTYQYTQSGELSTKIISDDLTAYKYDNYSNLLSIVLPSNETIEYIVDAENRRIGKLLDGNLVQGYLYRDQLNPTAELDGSGNVLARFVYGMRDNIPDYMIKNGEKYLIISDHIGSPRLVINSSSNEIVQRLDYDTYGNVLLDTNPGFQPFGFAGGLYDRHSKLVRFGARDYNPLIGRWVTSDPIGFDGGSSNLYVYASNDPVNFIDSTGFSSIHAQLLAAIGRGNTQQIRNIMEVLRDPKLNKMAQDALDKFGSKADDWITQNCKAGIRRKIPSNMLDKTLEEIRKGKSKEHRSAWKLLNDNRFKK